MVSDSRIEILFINYLTERRRRRIINYRKNLIETLTVLWRIFIFGTSRRHPFIYRYIR